MLVKEKEKRMKYIMIAIGMVFLAIAIKLFYEQVIHHNEILKKAQNLWERDFHISGIRGSILDRNGYILAQDVPTSSLVVVPSQIENPKEAATLLSEILEMDCDDLYERITKKVSTQKIQPEGRLLNDEKADQILSLNLKGVYLVQDSKRYYPMENYLAQTLGFSGIDNQGLAGLELQYDAYLTAKKGSLNIGFDAKGQTIDEYAQKREESGRGNDLVLTIDKIFRI